MNFNPFQPQLPRFMPSLNRGNSLSDIAQLFQRTDNGSGTHVFHEQSHDSGRYQQAFTNVPPGP